MKIGFIGLGIMGSRMAANLQAAGHNLVVYNRTPEKADSLVNKGATRVNTPAEVAQASIDILITMLSTPQAVEAVALGEQGFLPALSPSTIWIDSSTVYPAFSRQMASVAAEHQIQFLEAPVAGSKPQADAAQLIFIVGGDADTLELCQPLFDVMGSRVVHVGEHGMGTSLKVVVNSLLATSMLAFSEAIVLGQGLGIPQETLLNILVGGPVVPPFMAGKKDKMLTGTYDPEFPLQWMHKDLQMVALAAYDAQVAMPNANLAKEVYMRAVSEGFGDSDFSAIYALLNGDKGKSE